VEYRDFKYVIGFLVQLWMFATPVVYPLKLVPESYRGWLSLNPMAGLIEGFRSALLGRAMDWGLLGTSALIGVGLFVTGVVYFRKMEHRFADLI